MTAKKDINNVNEIQQALISHVSYRKFYNQTKVNARGFLTNISYNRVKDVDLTNDSFIIDCYTFNLFYLNPFYLERKFEEIIDRKKFEALWNCFMPSNFYVFICNSEYFRILNKISLKYQTAYKIISKFVKEDGLAQLRCFFKQNAFIYQFIYSTLFPKYFCRIDDKAIESKCCFELIFNNYKAQKHGYSLMQQIRDIVGIKDNDCNSLTVEVGSNAADENIKKTKTNLEEKENNKMRKLKSVKKRKRKEEKNSKVILRLIQKN